MRLLSIFALLFLVSLMLHSGAGKRTQAGMSAEYGQALEPDPAEQGASQEVAETQEDFSGLIFETLPVGHFEFEKEDKFSIIEIEIKNLIVDGFDGILGGRFIKENNFCAVGYVFPRSSQGRKKTGQRKEVIVYWREEKMIYRWAGGDPKAAKENSYSARSLLSSVNPISVNPIPLNGDPPMENGGASEENRAAFRRKIENTLADCEQHGKQYTIAPFKPPDRGFHNVSVPRPPARANRPAPDDSASSRSASPPERPGRPPRPASALPYPAPATPYPGPIYSPEPPPPEPPPAAEPSPSSAPLPSPEPALSPAPPPSPEPSSPGEGDQTP
jgi:hypothetical protein